MFVFDAEKKPEVDSLYQMISYLPAEWECVSLKLHRPDAEVLEKLCNQILALNQNQSGMIIKFFDYKVVYFQRSGGVKSFTPSLGKIEKQLQAFEVHVSTLKVTKDYLNWFFENYINPESFKKNELYLQRMARKENRILVVDDDMFVRKVIKQGFSDIASVKECETPQGVSEILKDFNPDIIFLDIHMPDKNGFEINNEILKIDPDAYIVMVSSDSSKDIVIKTSLHGADGFLAKPIRREKLTDHAKRCITFS